MRIFAVGATGVLGKSLVPVLLARGHEVTVMAPDRLEELPAQAIRVRAGLLDPGLRLSELVSGHDAVANLATSMPRDPAAPGAWEQNTRIRSQGTARLIDAVHRAGVGRLVQMSITMAYADGGDFWLDEDAPFDPDPAREAVVRPVAEMEAAVRALPPGETAWCILRGARFAGPGTFQDVQRDRLAQGALRVPGDGRAFVSMVHVADFADAVARALEWTPAGRVLNVADTPLPVAEYYTALAEANGYARPGQDPGAPHDLPSHRVDSRAARSVLGWKPERGVLPGW